MKKNLTILISVLSFSLFAQAPQGLNYQATVRNSLGNLITNQNVYFRFNIMQNSSTSVPIYSETHYVPTDDLGQVNCVIGQGTATTGVFSQIDWSNGTYFLGIELNIGSGYVAMGTTQFLSVPYALYAGNVSGSSLTLNQVANNGNTADRVVTGPNQSGIRVNTTGGNNGSYYFGITSWIQGTNGTNRAIQGVSNGINSSYNEGILGFATNSTVENVGTYGAGFGSTAQYNTGVKGEADSGYESYGIIGASSNATSRNYGVAGYARQTAPSGVYNIGVFGGADNSEGFNYCVWGGSDNGNTTNGITIGVLGTSNSPSINGTNYGIYGTASNALNNYAGVFNGDVTVTGTFFNPSDRKLKKEISNLTSALDKIEKLKPVTYFYDTDKNKNIKLPKNRQYGFVAQDLEEVFPDLVTKQTIVIPNSSTSKGSKTKILKPEQDPNNPSQEDVNLIAANENDEIKNEPEEFKGVNYIGLISILTEGIKEQQAQIKELKSKNEVLEKRISAIETLLKK
ncbi:MAG: tail fiber domain-containing protein [Flavobacterium sp.]|uniref:tail fiber domain-containing protein n=1 Tax=Flavobacterium sp. TaxID=239 RepID=UPI003BE57FEF